MGYKKYLQDLTESSLSRLQKHMFEHDTGTITAFRYAKMCGTGTTYDKKENLKRNKSLLAKLQSKRYGVTSVKGSYIENYGSSKAKEVGENVFFVVDLNDTGKLLNDLKKLGLEFEQDSILYIPKGGKESSLIGTNKCPDAYPGFGKKIKFKSKKMGEKGEFFTRVKGRPFIFKESLELTEHILPQGMTGRWACSSTANLHWSKIEI